VSKLSDELDCDTFAHRPLQLRFDDGAAELQEEFARLGGATQHVEESNSSSGGAQTSLERSVGGYFKFFHQHFCQASHSGVYFAPEKEIIMSSAFYSITIDKI
jgi:hypothetical protein